MKSGGHKGRPTDRQRQCKVKCKIQRERLKVIFTLKTRPRLCVKERERECERVCEKDK